MTIALIAIASTALIAAAESSLIDAAKSADTEQVRTLLSQGAAIDATEPDGTTALHWSSYRDDLDSARLLIRAGADVNASNDLGATPLWTASQNGSVDMVRELLEAGADPNVRLLLGETPLMVAARVGQPEIVDLLASRGADVDARGARDQTALMWAAAQGHAAVVEVLLAHGAEVHARSATWTEVMAVPPHSLLSRDIPHGGNTALLFAARSGDVESARSLIDGGADVDDANAWGVSATVLAAHSGYTDLVELLLTHGADPNAAAAGFAALHEAVMRRDERMVRTLLEHGAEPDVRLATWTPTRRSSADHNFAPALVGATPLWLAARFAEPQLMRLLIGHGADPLFVHDVEYQQDYRGPTAARPHEATTIVMAATGMGDDVGRAWVRPRRVEPERAVLEAVVLGVELGVPVDAAGPDGNTALHAAAVRGYDEVISYLVAHGARLDVSNADGETPLVAAQARGRGGRTVELLLSLAGDEHGPGDQEDTK